MKKIPISDPLQGGSLRYGSLDGLRAYGAIAIVLMHVYVNGGYAFAPAVSRALVSFTDGVFLFMLLSGFSVCCGYFEKLIKGQVSLVEFYTRRYRKIWPFFAVLVVLDLMVSPGVESLYEVFANLTLCFGLLPNADIQVIGVGWTLGVIFVFYLLFPFVCYLLSDKKRAWLSFGAALALHLLCRAYFFDENHMPADFSSRSSFVYCAVYFLAGGMLYLYRQELTALAEKLGLGLLPVAGVLAAGYYLTGGEPLMALALFAVLTVYAMGRRGRPGVLNNRFTAMLRGISMEIYLCHMVIWRVVEKLDLAHVLPWSWASYILAALLTFGGAVVFAFLARYALKKASDLLP